MITVIDYGMGNLFSVQNTLEAMGAEAIVSNKRSDLEKSDRVILPGVGAFPDGMKHLKELGLIEILKLLVLKKKKPFLGICLGMQLLASVGEEHKLTDGLGWFTGRVRRFQADEKKFPIPHVGWNDVLPQNKETLFKDVQSQIFYFAHSYHFVPENQSIVAATCTYGETFVAAVQQDNIFGIQFHPEKSQKSGLKVLENFLSYA